MRMDTATRDGIDAVDNNDMVRGKEGNLHRVGPALISRCGKWWGFEAPSFVWGLLMLTAEQNRASRGKESMCITS